MFDAADDDSAAVFSDIAVAVVTNDDGYDDDDDDDVIVSNIMFCHCRFPSVCVCVCVALSLSLLAASLLTVNAFVQLCSTESIKGQLEGCSTVVSCTFCLGCTDS